jgi:hypothetical protein
MGTKGEEGRRTKEEGRRNRIRTAYQEEGKDGKEREEGGRRGNAPRGSSTWKGTRQS